MLRITIHDSPESLMFRLEGNLTGVWVQEAEHCWREAADAGRTKIVRFDLTQVTHIDSAGKSFLATRHADGAELIAAGCWTRALVAQIVGLQS